MIGEIIVAVPAASRALNPAEVLLFSGYIVENFLDVSRLGQCVIVDLNNECRYMDILCVLDWRHLIQGEASNQLNLSFDLIDPIRDAQYFGNPFVERS